MSRRMAKSPQLPETYLSMLPPSENSTLVSIKIMAEDYAARCSSFTPNPSSIAPFLLEKYSYLEKKNQYLRQYLLALRTLRRTGAIKPPEYRQERVKLSGAYYASTGEAIDLKLSKRIITEDMTDYLDRSQTLEDAYKAAMVDRVRVAASARSPAIFNRQQFRREVLRFHEATRQASGGPESWCHVMGEWLPAKEVQVAHLVPKSINPDYLAYLFGGQVTPASDVRNCLLLDRNVVPRLDNGDIAIAPLVGEEDQWRCIVTRPDKMKQHLGVGRTLKDLHKRRLTFCSWNRPAKRYLFFRFLITYITCQSEGYVDWAKDIEKDIQGWATPGGYLRQSTLETLAKDFCDEEVGAKMLEICKEATFSDGEGSFSEIEKALFSERLALSMAKLALPPSAVLDGEADIGGGAPVPAGSED